MSAPFPAVCPACGAEVSVEQWNDPVTRIVHDRVVRHRGDCRIYRERDYDRSELVAHLMEQRCACGRPGPDRAADCHAACYGGDFVQGLDGRQITSCRCSCHRRAAA